MGMKRTRNGNEENKEWEWREQGMGMKRTMNRNEENNEWEWGEQGMGMRRTRNGNEENKEWEWWYKSITKNGNTGILTGSPTVTTPCNCTTLGWLNCPIMAASWRSFTFSSSGEFVVTILTAMPIGPFGDCHTPSLTVPNCPDPRCLVILQGKSSSLIVIITS